MSTTIVGVVSQKGGVGKSSISRALACEAAKNGLDVKIADLDTQQGTSVKWVQRRLKNDIEPVVRAEPFKTAQQALKAASNHDLLIIDGPARASAGTADIAEHADIVVQPTGASLDDLEPAVLVFHELVKKGIDRKKLFFALSRISTSAEDTSAREYLAESGYAVLDGCIYEKASYRKAQNLGNALTEVPYKTLKEQADNLIQSLINNL